MGCQVAQKLLEIRSASGDKEKFSIIESVVGAPYEEIFRKVIELAYSPFIVFDVKKLPSDFQYGDGCVTYDTLLGVENLVNVRGRKDKAQAIVDIVSTLSPEAGEVVCNIIRKDLRCGVGPKTFNRVWSDLVYIHPYQRCSSLSKKTLSKIKVPCIGEVKEDGMYSDIVVSNEGVHVFSREGLQNNHFIVDELREFLVNNKPHLEGCSVDEYVLMGEALVSDGSGGYLPRKIGNGILGSDDLNPDSVRFVLWDVVPLEDFKARKCDIRREDRLMSLLDFTSLASERITPVDVAWCETMEDVFEFFKKTLSKNKEGIIVKNIDAPWVDGTSPDQVKFKVEATGEVRVTGVNEGANRLKGSTGSLSYESSCGRVVGNIAGISDKMRKEYFEHPETIIGKIIEVKFNDIVSSEGKDTLSLYLPRMIEVRDKTEADDLERLREAMKAAMFAVNI